MKLSLLTVCLKRSGVFYLEDTNLGYLKTEGVFLSHAEVKAVGKEIMGQMKAIFKKVDDNNNKKLQITVAQKL